MNAAQYPWHPTGMKIKCRLLNNGIFVIYCVREKKKKDWSIFVVKLSLIEARNKCSIKNHDANLASRNHSFISQRNMSESIIAATRNAKSKTTKTRTCLNIVNFEKFKQHFHFVV